MKPVSELTDAELNAEYQSFQGGSGLKPVSELTDAELNAEYQSLKNNNPKDSGMSPFSYDLTSLPRNLVMGVRQSAANINKLAANTAGLLGKGYDLLANEYDNSEISNKGLAGVEQYFRGAASSIAPTQEELANNQDVISKIYRGIGQAPGDIATYGLASIPFGPAAGMAAVNAISESDKGLVPTIQAAAEGGLMGGILHAASPLKRLQRMGTMGGIGAGEAALKGGDAGDIVSSGVTMGGLGYIGGKQGLTYKDVYNDYQTAKIQGKADKFFKAVADITGMTVDDVKAKWARDEAGQKQILETPERPVEEMTDAELNTEYARLQDVQQAKEGAVKPEQAQETDTAKKAEDSKALGQLKSDMATVDLALTPIQKSNRSQVSDAVRAAKERKSKDDLFVYPTDDGYGIEQLPPPLGTPYIVIKPDGTHETFSRGGLYNTFKAVPAKVLKDYPDLQKAKGPVETLGAAAQKVTPEQPIAAVSGRKAGTAPPAAHIQFIKDMSNLEPPAKRYDAEGNVIGRIKSERPKWLQNVVKDYGLKYQGLRNVLDKYSNGEKLTARQQEFVNILFKRSKSDFRKVNGQEIILPKTIPAQKDMLGATKEGLEGKLPSVETPETPLEKAQAEAQARAAKAEGTKAQMPLEEKPKTPNTTVDLYAGVPIVEAFKSAGAALTAAGKTKPMKNAIDIIRSIKKSIAPSTMSPEHLSAAVTVGKHLGKFRHEQEITERLFRKESERFDRSGVHKEGDITGIQFGSDIAQGKESADINLRPIAAKARALLERKGKEALKEGVLKEVIDNYFPGMWTPASIRAFEKAMGEAIDEGVGSKDVNVNQWTTDQKAWVKDRTEAYMKTGEGSDNGMLAYLFKRPIAGKESFRQQKVFDDGMTGYEFGLKPVSNNPIDIIKLKAAEIDRAIMAKRLFNEWNPKLDIATRTLAKMGIGSEAEIKALKDASNKNIIFVRLGHQPPEGYDKINDKYGDVAYRNEAGEVVSVGNRYARKPIADVLNAYTSKSLYNYGASRGIYTAWMGLANTLNQSQLGLGSFFHAGFTYADVVISANANIIKDSEKLLKGKITLPEFGKTLTHLVKALASPLEIIPGLREKGLTAYGEGRDILKAYRENPENMPKEIQQIVRAIELAGGSFKQESGLQTTQTEKMLRNWYRGERLSAALRSPVALTELMAKPIMEWIVPAQKAGVFGELAVRIIRDNKGKDLEALAPEFRQAWNRVDARLGQVRYDRLFINNAVKNVIQGLIRAPGWTGGTIAEVGGSVKDAANYFKQWGETGKRPDKIPDRVAYTVSLLLTNAVLNGALTYAFTGDKPKGMDYWAFRTGGLDEAGRPERFVLPTYSKDLMSYYNNFIHTLIVKQHPALTITAQLKENKDYYGVEIRHLDDTPGQQAIDTGLFILKQFQPFWTRGTQRALERGEKGLQLAAPLIGVMPASSEYTHSPAERLTTEYYKDTIPVGARTKVEYEKSELKAEFYRAMQQGKVRELAPKTKSKIADMSEEELANIVKNVGSSALERQFRRISVEHALKVWAKADKKEKEKLLEPFIQKLGSHVEKLNHEEQQVFLNQVRKLKDKN